ncbi:hypothetical protein ACLB2K_051763 [Fragaria x ananassa]
MEREEDESVSELLRDQFRLSTIHIAESEGNSDLQFDTIPFRFWPSSLFDSRSPSSEENRDGDIGTGDGLYFRPGLQIYWKNCVTTKRKLPVLKTEQLAKDLELFTHHASRKSANMEDVILCAHRNEHLAALLRSYRDDLKAKEPQSDRKRKKASKKDDRAPEDIVHIPDN